MNAKNTVYFNLDKFMLITKNSNMIPRTNINVNILKIIDMIKIFQLKANINENMGIIRKYTCI